MPPAKNKTTFFYTLTALLRPVCGLLTPGESPILRGHDVDAGRLTICFGSDTIYLKSVSEPTSQGLMPLDHLPTSDQPHVPSCHLY